MLFSRHESIELLQHCSSPSACHRTTICAWLTVVMSTHVAHKLRVQLLYRRMLKEQLNWKAQRDVWLQNALYTRMLFENKMQLRDTGEIEAALSDGTKWLESRRHPDPYTSHTHYHTHTHNAQQHDTHTEADATAWHSPPRIQRQRARARNNSERRKKLVTAALWVRALTSTVCVVACWPRSSHTVGWLFVPA